MLSLALIIITSCFHPEVEEAHVEEVKTVNVSFEAEWECTKNENGIALYERWVKVNEKLKVRERRGEITVSKPYNEVVNYLSQMRTLKEWMGSIEQVKPLPPTATDDSLVYLLFKFPWPFANRDLVTRCSIKHPNQHQTIVSLISRSDAVGVQKDIVRIKSYKASWDIRLLPDGRTKVILYTFSDEPPLFPRWLQDPVVNEMFYSNLLKLKTILDKR